MKVCVIGHFGFGENLLNGQTIKTKIITKELEKQLGREQVRTIDSRGGVKAMFKLFRQVGQAMKCSENIIMLPAHNGVRFFAPVLYFWKKIYKSKIHYLVIGGWLPELVKKDRLLGRVLRRFDGIYVETSTLKNKLEEIGFNNIVVIPNCKELHILKEEELVYSCEEPYKLCTFSRVMKEKGIEDAINAVKEVNEYLGHIVFELDIYGQIDEQYKEQFEIIQSEMPKYIRYRGMVPYEESVETLKNYYALMFPTKFYTEGIPGTIIDAYASGVPVISSRWESFQDLIDDDIVGKGYEFGNYDALVSVLIDIAKNPDVIVEMKKNCIKKAIDYSAFRVVNKLITKME